MIKMFDGIIIACVWSKWYWLNAQIQWVNVNSEAEATEAAKAQIKSKR